LETAKGKTFTDVHNLADQPLNHKNISLEEGEMDESSFSKTSNTILLK
jgi:hypothetical protein